MMQRSSVYLSRMCHIHIIHIKDRQQPQQAAKQPCGSQPQVLAGTMKASKRFLDAFTKGLPLWRAHFALEREGVVAALRRLSKCTRVLQILCAESKSRKDLPLTAKASRHSISV